MAASLANGGLCPLSGDQVLSPAATRSMLSMMQVAGMKDYSTTFHYKVQSPSCIILYLSQIKAHIQPVSLFHCMFKCLLCLQFVLFSVNKQSLVVM